MQLGLAGLDLAMVPPAATLPRSARTGLTDGLLNPEAALAAWDAPCGRRLVPWAGTGVAGPAGRMRNAEFRGHP